MRGHEASIDVSQPLSAELVAISPPEPISIISVRAFPAALGLATIAASVKPALRYATFRRIDCQQVSRNRGASMPNAKQI